ncbi:DUF4124 domain-containing protein [Haliea sp. E17]|uniref:DUF4124 domain-containing protein n=1 Tax=Haliea sp. E17 TaxID=3401576 RepID=UPI003AAAD5C8
MRYPRITLIALATLLALPLASHAGVFICVDPQTGKKTFTDKACPDAAPGEKVRVDPVNFNRGATARQTGTWNSDRDTSKDGSDYASANQRRLQSAKSTGYLPQQN